MTINQANLHDAPSLAAAEPLLIDRGALFLQRTAIVAAAAAADADDVDRRARFPKAAIDAARREKLLGMQIPLVFGGHGASIHGLPRPCRTRHATLVWCMAKIMPVDAQARPSA